MRFSLTADHREFFNKNNYIELQGILPLAQVASLKKHAIEALEKKLNLSFAKIQKKPSRELFLAGYDLWRSSDPIKKIVHKNAIATVASELFQTFPLRFGFDQYFLIDENSISPFAENFTLQETSCLSPIAGALILPLEDLSAPLPFFPMPENAGSGLFISPSLPIPWKELFATPGLNFIMIAFAPKKTFFLADTRDPHAITLKKLGYVFNEFLRNPTHPILLNKGS